MHFKSGVGIPTAYKIAKAYFAQPAFKVGDRVKVVKDPKEWNDLKVGYVGEVLEMDSGDGTVFIKGIEGTDWTPVECLEPVQE